MKSTLREYNSPRKRNLGVLSPTLGNTCHSYYYSRSIKCKQSSVYGVFFDRYFHIPLPTDTHIDKYLSIFCVSFLFSVCMFLPIFLPVFAGRMKDRNMQYRGCYARYVCLLHFPPVQSGSSNTASTFYGPVFSVDGRHSFPTKLSPRPNANRCNYDTIVWKSHLIYI